MLFMQIINHNNLILIQFLIIYHILFNFFNNQLLYEYDIFIINFIFNIQLYFYFLLNHVNVLLL